MLLVNPKQLTAEAERLGEVSAELLRAYDTVSSVSAALSAQKPLDSVRVNLAEMLRTIEDEIGAVSRLSRALEQVSSTYTACERAIENNCESSAGKYRVDAFTTYRVPPLG